MHHDRSVLGHHCAFGFCPRNDRPIWNPTQDSLIGLPPTGTAFFEEPTGAATSTNGFARNENGEQGHFGMWVVPGDPSRTATLNNDHPHNLVASAIETTSSFNALADANMPSSSFSSEPVPDHLFGLHPELFPNVGHGDFPFSFDLDLSSSHSDAHLL